MIRSLMIILFLACLFTPAPAATLIVNSTANDGEAYGCQPDHCTLLGALADAVNGDVIDLTGVSGTIVTGGFTVAAEVTITGPGVDALTITDNGTRQVFIIDAETTITDLTITTPGLDSIGGSAVAANQPVHLERVAIRDGASADSGPVYIRAPGSSITDSIISGNLTFCNIGFGFGGAVTVTIAEAVSAPVRIVNTTVSDNVLCATGDPYTGQGGGIGVTHGTVEIRNVTIARNEADSGGGLYVGHSGYVTVADTIIIGNTASTGAGDTDTVNAASLTDSHSIVGQTDGTNFDNDTTVTGVDPMYVIDLTLKDNGGLLRTHALLDIGLGIDRGGSDLAADSRGFPRDDAPDIGSFELQQPVFTPAALNFSNTRLNTEVFADVAVVIGESGVSVTGFATPFVIKGESGLTVDPGDCIGSFDRGDSCTFTVTFSPDAFADYRGTVDILWSFNGNDYETTLNAPGTAVAPEVSVSPAAVAFAETVVGGSLTETVIVTNDAGATDDLLVSGVTLTDPAGVFSAAHACGAALGPGDSCPVDVTFTPDAAGTFSASATVETDFGSWLVSLSGAGVQPAAPEPGDEPGEDAVDGASSGGGGGCSAGAGGGFGLLLLIGLVIVRLRRAA